MFGRSRSWVGGSSGKSPRNIHSLEHLKYMYHVLTKNTTVTESNRNLLVETIRSITEILIWGDQNDSSVFDFFLEKNMFVFFLNILRQKSGRFVCVQLLQTINILFENISHETSLYYLLSNNHVNSIIVHKFDFSDEEIMAYYISFLKTLSLKLNNHTVHFFYNEHTNDFALYTEAIKFFNHPESMVRIAVRTITLNVYKVSLDNQLMLHYIRDKTAVPYFSNLVWFIGSHVIELDNCVQTDEEHMNRGKLSDLVAEHLDHLHYLNDILTINCEFLNDVLADHLLNRLFLPLYVYSLVTHEQCGDRPKISRQASLYLLSQVFLIIHFRPLVNSLAEVILNGDLSMFGFHSEQEALKHSMSASIRCFTKPVETLERSLEISRHKGRKRVQKRPNYKNVGEEDEEEKGIDDKEDDTERLKEIEMVIMERCKISGSQISGLMEQNTTDEEKTAAAARTNNPRRRPFLDLVYKALECFEEDYYALFVLCLLFAISHNTGVDSDLLEKIQIPPENAKEKSSYSHVLAERLIKIMNQSTRSDAKIRLATLELACLLLRQLVLSDGTCIIKDVHLACHEGAREESVHLLRRFYKGEDIFLDMFEDEYRVMMSKPLNVEYLMMDASILLPPTGTPLTGIDFVKRLPCGDVEKTRRAIRVFLMLRSLSLQLQGEPETQLPLTREEDLIKTDDVLDLNQTRPFLDLVYKALECFEEDYYALFVLCLLFAISHNTGVDSDLLEKIQIPPENAKEKSSYSHVLAERLIKIMNQSTRSDAKIRLATLELACLLLRQLVLSDGTCIIKDVHLACHEGAREESVHLLRRFYKGEDIFLDMFEDEYRVMMSKPLNVEYLMMDASILLPPTGTPLTGIDFVKRLPCGDVEKTRRAIRVFLMLRSLSLQLQGEPETQLPLTREEDLIKTDDVLDLNNSDLIACTVVSKDIGQVHRFLAVDVYQMSLVEPENKRLGWGVVKFAGLLQDMQVMGVEDDSRALNIIIHKPASNPHARPFPILQATFIFADHIRCIIAKQRLAKGRIQARRMKMQRIAVLLDLPVQTSSEVMGFGHGSPSSAHHLPFRFYDQSRRGVSDPTVQRSVFASVDKVPGLESTLKSTMFEILYKARPGFAVAQHINQQSPSPASSPSPPSSGTITTSTGYSDTITTSVASTPSATQSPTDGPELQEQSHLTFPDQVEFVNESHSSPPTAEGGSSCYHLPSSTEPEAANLAPSLTPAHQPNISLISDDNTDALSVESLTLLPPADAQHIRSVSTLSQTSALSESNGMIENENNNRQSEVSESMHGRHHNV
ncbi:protein CLEC16A [Amblyraja radiata]|uniref:protein CLEC16A n=1 Tax=Amblyraja radiata TaxID=386614 RepID=UPI00140389F0|nr:protein CLEC16A [Amblyraja radiata]